jgi:hypothetical protein
MLRELKSWLLGASWLARETKTLKFRKLAGKSSSQNILNFANEFKEQKQRIDKETGNSVHFHPITCLSQQILIL